MREIKFRLLDTDVNQTRTYTLQELIATTYRRGKFRYRGRWTGLKDKNGVEIYEGDIVFASVWGRAGYNYDDNFEVGFIDGCFCAIQERKPLNATCLDKTSDREVIGNIYENKELLGGN